MEIEEYFRRKSYAGGDLNFEDTSQVIVGYYEGQFYILVYSKRRKEGLYGTHIPWENTALVVFKSSPPLKEIQQCITQRLQSQSEATFQIQFSDVTGEFENQKVEKTTVSKIQFFVESAVITFCCYASDGSQLGAVTIPIAERFENGEYQDEKNLKGFSHILDDILNTAESNQDTSQNVKQRNTEEHKNEYDIFISHASEDKDDFVRSLRQELADLGLDVWYDEDQLGMGDDLRGALDEGLVRSQYSVVVLSKHYFAKKWPKAELSASVSMDSLGQKVILPIMYGINHEDVMAESPLLGAKYISSSASQTIPEIAEEIYQEVANSK